MMMSYIAQQGKASKAPAKATFKVTTKRRKRRSRAMAPRLQKAKARSPIRRRLCWSKPASETRDKDRGQCFMPFLADDSLRLQQWLQLAKLHCNHA